MPSSITPTRTPSPVALFCQAICAFVPPGPQLAVNSAPLMFGKSPGACGGASGGNVGGPTGGGGGGGGGGDPPPPPPPLAHAPRRTATSACTAKREALIRLVMPDPRSEQTFDRFVSAGKRCVRNVGGGSIGWAPFVRRGLASSNVNVRCDSTWPHRSRSLWPVVRGAIVRRTLRGHVLHQSEASPQIKAAIEESVSSSRTVYDPGL